jgi:glutamate/tyrosine decarboxylase-like PLP-dependent enzyme
MIDPLAACAEIAARGGLWYHVDAAWAGAAIASDRLRGLLAGLERADSVTIDAHKWFATTMGCGMFLSRHPSVLCDVFSVSTTYMPSRLEGVDPYVTSVQWSRRFLGLRLFLALAAAGWEGYARHVERACWLMDLLRSRLTGEGWSVLNDSSVAVLCLAPPFGLPSRIVANVLASGRAWISTATFEGREVIRACATHGETTERDVDELVNALRAALHQERVVA